MRSPVKLRSSTRRAILSQDDADAMLELTEDENIGKENPDDSISSTIDSLTHTAISSEQNPLTVTSSREAPPTTNDTGERKSDGSFHSKDSDPAEAKIGELGDHPIISVMASDTDVTFLIGDDRTATCTEGSNQDDHVSAARLILQLVYAGIDGIEIQDIPKTLLAIYSCYMVDQANLDTLRNIIGTFSKEINDLSFDKKSRKDDTAAFRIGNELASKIQTILSSHDESLTKEEKQKSTFMLKQLEVIDVEKHKKSMKTQHNLEVGKVISKIAKEIIQKTNLMPDMAFPILAETAADKGEGGRIRGSIASLRKLNRFMKLTHSLDLDSVKEQDKSLNGLRRELKSMSMITTGRKDITENLVSKISSDTRDGLSEAYTNLFNTNEIATRITHLFHYPCSTERAKNPEALSDLLGRHLVLVFNAFQGLQNFPEEIKSDIITNICQQVLTKESKSGERWAGKLDDESKTIENEAQVLRTQTLEKIFLGVDGQYCMKGSVLSSTLLTETSNLHPNLDNSVGGVV